MTAISWLMGAVLMSPLQRRIWIGAGASLAVATLLFGFWLITPPGDVAAYSRGAMTSWAKRQQVQQQNPKRALRHTYAPLNAISVEMQFAIIAGEDVGYLSHGPWDLSAVREALGDWRRGKRLRGASTLTQQLAKNLYLSDERSLWRKVREARYAYWLEDRLGKKRVLELYANMVELGEGLFGVQAAAMRYFGVNASALDAQQAAELAASIPSPRRHNPHTRTAAWRRRYRAIHARMARFGWMREDIAQLGGRAPLSDRAVRAPLRDEPHALPAGEPMSVDETEGSRTTDEETPAADAAEAPPASDDAARVPDEANADVSPEPESQ